MSDNTAVWRAANEIAHKLIPAIRCDSTAPFPIDAAADIICRELGLDEICEHLVARRRAVGGITHTHVNDEACAICIECCELDRLITKLGAAEVKP